MVRGDAFSGDASAARWFAEQPDWWESHYVVAVDEIVEFLAGDDVSLANRRVLDLGCGDGIISLGIATRTQAASVLGLDVAPVDQQFLADCAKEHGVAGDHPYLTFGTSLEHTTGLPDDSVDLVVTWSVFEHVADAPGLLAEIKRVLVPDGLLFLQIWPLYFSEHGSHLWPWFEEPYPHLRLGRAQLDKGVRDGVGSPGLAEAMLDLYDSCNKITLDELGSALTEAGFFVAKVQTESSAVHVPPELQKMPLSLLTTAGVKILAVKPGPPSGTGV
jgi:SAM-dependent methyltransferase